MGLSKLGFQDLIEVQYQMLVKYYESFSFSDKVCWKQFYDDIENGRLYEEFVISCIVDFSFNEKLIIFDFEI